MTTEYRLANVLFSDAPRSDSYPRLYYRHEKVPFVRADGTTVLSQPSCDKYDFATYFNALSWAKWRRYTTVDNVSLRIRAKGTFVVTYVGYEATGSAPRRVVLGTRRVASETFVDVDFAYPENGCTLLAFEVVTSSPVELAGAYYFTLADEAAARPVELAVATTTFRKEDYIVPNIELLRREVGESSEAVGGHFTLHVIDNGRTLDSEALSGGCVHVHPNPNVGGSGGFARGMIEAMEQEPRATHVILMDDDVQVSPESVKRTYNLLQFVRDEWTDAFVSGAMLSLEEQDLFHEDIGHINGDGIYEPAKKERRLTKVKALVSQEKVPLYRRNTYAGWWFCCIPVATIEREGLPLPLFVRGDDTEYGARCSSGRFITMNGICIWHATFATRFRANIDRYQVLRNSLIGQATTGVFADVDFMHTVRMLFSYDLKTFFYDGCALTCRALEDYLRGPRYLELADGAKLMAETSKLNERPVPLEQIEGLDVSQLDIDEKQLKKNGEREMAVRAYDYLTMNGQRVPGFGRKDSLGVVYNDGYYPNRIRNHTRLLALEGNAIEGTLRTYDSERARDVSERFKRACAEYDRRREEVAAEWSAARDELTSVAFWKRYLKERA